METQCSSINKTVTCSVKGPLGESSVLSTLPSTPSSFPSPEKESLPALPKGSPPLNRCRCSAAGSSLEVPSMFAKGCLQISHPDIPPVQFILRNKKLHLQKALVPAAQNHCFGILWEIKNLFTLY